MVLWLWCSSGKDNSRTASPSGVSDMDMRMSFDTVSCYCVDIRVDTRGGNGSVSHVSN